MKSVSECQATVSEILEAIGMLGCVHEDIDSNLVTDYRDIPKPCVPEVLNDSDTPLPEGVSCPVESEVKALNAAHRVFARNALLSVADLMKTTGGGDMRRISQDVEEAAKKIDTGSGDLLLLPEITEIISENTFRMFALFDVCMRGV